MTIALARSRYRQAEAVGQPRIEDPHAVIAVTLTELERALSVLVAARAAGRPLHPRADGDLYPAIEP